MRFMGVFVALVPVLSGCGQDNVDNLDRSIAKPQIFAFQASPVPLSPGVPTHVSWSWRFVNDILPAPTCEIDQGVGVVLNGDATTIAVDVDTDFTLTCTNRAGTGTAVFKVLTTGNPPPNGDILLPPGVTINAGDSVDFLSACNDDTDLPAALVHLWNFGGAASDSTVQNPGPVRFPSPGRYTVTYTCTDSLGAPDPTPDTVVVAVMGYQAAASGAVTGGPVAVAVADLNNDTFQDIVYVKNTDGKVSVRLRDAATPANFLADVDYATGTNVSLSPVAVAVADVNGDTRPDLVVANQADDTVAVLLQNATTAGAFDAAVTYATGDGPSAVAVADFNNDTKADIAVVNTTDSTLSILMQDPLTAGIFLAADNYTTGNTPTSLAAGLLNSDDRIDIVVASSGSNQISLHFQFGSPNDPGHFRPKLDYAAGSGPSSVVLADFNGDSRLDIAVTNPASDEVSLLLQNSAPLTKGTFAVRVPYAAGDNPSFAAASDINGDGLADLLVANRSSDNISLLLPDRAHAGKFLDQIVVPTGDGPVGLAAGNLNTDALPDLVTADVDGGTISVVSHTLPQPGVSALHLAPEATNTASVFSFFVIVQPATTVTWTVDLTNDAGAALSAPTSGTCATTLQCSGTLTASGAVSITVTGGTDTVATLTTSATDTLITDSDSVDLTVDKTPPADPVITTNGGADFNVISPDVVIQGTVAADTAMIQVQTVAAGVFTDVAGYVAGSTTWTYNGTIDLGLTVPYCFQAIDGVGNISLTDCVNVTR